MILSGRINANNLLEGFINAMKKVYFEEEHKLIKISSQVRS